MTRLKDSLERPAELRDFLLEHLITEFPYYIHGIEDGFAGCSDEKDPVETPTPEADDNYMCRCVH